MYYFIVRNLLLEHAIYVQSLYQEQTTPITTLV